MGENNKGRLCVDRISLDVADDELTYDFQFTIENPVNSDVALEKASSAIKEFREFLIEKDEYRVLDDLYNVAERGFIRIGEIPDANMIEHASIDSNKVFQLGDISNSDIILQEGKSPVLSVYAIDGTPSKRYIFCRTTIHKEPSNFSNYFGEHIFTVTDHFDRFVGSIAVTIAEPGYWVELNQDTQLARVGDFYATPENMFNVATFRVDGEEFLEEYSVIPQRNKRSSSPQIRTIEVPTLYDGDRFEMEIDIPLGFQQNSEVIIEPHKLFAEKINEVLSSDIKYQLNGGNDWISLKYAPMDSVDEVFQIAKDVVSSSNKLLSDKK